MKAAHRTWALVVGIDLYDALTPLRGAARDAVAYVKWLRRLGVPDSNIVLHAAPSAVSEAEVTALGLPVLGCTERDLSTSFARLAEGAGDRLFVFLCGHGFYEPGGGRVFLTSDARDGMMRNLGIERYARWLRGSDYRRQYLFMDGCLNLPYTASVRARFEPGTPSSVVMPPARPDVVQVLACAAAMGERALENAAGGVFTRSLLGALDLDRPNELCVDVDDTAGELTLSLADAVRHVVAPAVAEHASRDGRAQTPTVQILSDGPAPDVLAVATLETDGSADVTVTVRPGLALPDVNRITLWSDTNMWRRVVPTGPGGRPGVPHVSTVPAGLNVSVSCTVVPDGRWTQPPAQHVVADADRSVVFSLGPRATGPGRGRPRSAVPPSRPVPSAGRPARLEFLISAEQARALAGPLVDEPTVQIRDRTVSLNQLLRDPAVDVEPGGLAVRVVLPWGSWSAVVHAMDGQATPVRLPVSVGRPPLRVRLADRTDNTGAPRTIVLFSHGSGTALDPARPSQDPVPLTPDGETGPALVLAAPAAGDGGPGRWQGVAQIRTANGFYRLPLNDNGAIGLLRGRAPRAEPLSRVPSSAWDRLVTAGRLEDVPSELVDLKWDDPLLGVAGAYACLAQEEPDLLERVLVNLRRLDPALPDLPILDAALDRLVGRRREPTGARLRDSTGTPLFRWGAAFGVLAADHYDLPGPRHRYRELENRLVPTSIWTLWRPKLDALDGRPEPAVDKTGPGGQRRPP